MWYYNNMKKKKKEKEKANVESFMKTKFVEPIKYKKFET